MEKTPTLSALRIGQYHLEGDLEVDFADDFDQIRPNRSSRTSRRNCVRRRRSCFCTIPSAIVACLLLALTTLQLTSAALLQGCNFGEDLCDQGEVCIPDGLFGQCYSDIESDLVKPLILDEPLDELQNELLRTELSRLANNGLDWPHARSQCVLAYFKLTVVYQLDYDTEFCSVRNPNNIWSLVQRVQNALVAEQEMQNEALSEAIEEQQQQQQQQMGNNDENVEGDGSILVPADAVDMAPLASEDDQQQQQPEEVEEDGTVILPVFLVDDPVLVEPNEQDGVEQPYQEQPLIRNGEEDVSDVLRAMVEQLNEANQGSSARATSEKRSAPEPVELSEAEEKQLDGYVRDILNNKSPDMKQLNNKQLDKLVSLTGSLENLLAGGALQRGEVLSDPEMEEIIPLASENSDSEQLMLLKKDAEKFQNTDMGLANTVHKIVKGGVQRVEGNRVYLKVAKNNITEEELYKLIAYLDRKIAEPNNLYFDEFAYEDGQLSFRISQADLFQPAQKKSSSEKVLDNASGVAQAVYKRRKDIQTLAGVEVDETGIGSGVDVVPVEKSERDWLFFPIMAVCALTIASLVSVLAVHVFYKRRRSCSSYKSNLPEVIDHLEGKPCTVYEDLCRQRMSGQDMPVAVSVRKTSKHSSTSSWPDESLLQTSNLDISTGHVILNFLKSCLEKPNEISDQWSSLKDYQANAPTTLATDQLNAEKNYDSSVLPYDESAVVLASKQDDAQSSYINATKIHDSDPRQVAYIASQTPTPNTTNAFWQMVWEQGIALIVNLCDQEENQKSARCAKYWPEEGSKVYGNFEVYLVSEHIWSEDYVVRSLYLKNQSTNETRTVTQFHYLTWSEGGVPANIKSMLEFRRKINKSYRGHSSPVLVHCSNGAGRTGTYTLIDMAINRILKGVKELNIAGSLEYLRDQRMRMVENEEQYKFVFSCVAEEVSSLLKNLQH